MIDAMRRSHKRSGFGLVELLLAMVIGMFLTAGMVQIFIGSKKAYGTQEAMGRVQENGRLAMGMLTQDIRMGGYQGCGSLSRIEPNVIAKDVPGTGTFGSEDAVIGYEYSGTAFSPNYGDPSSTSDDPANVLTNTDVITISHADDCGAYLVGNMAAENANIQLNGDNSCDFVANDLLLITDCVSSDLFRATTVSVVPGVITIGTMTIAHASNGNTTNFLSKTYGEDARIYRFIRRDFFIRNNPFGEPALYMRENEGTPQELVEGVSDLQILYGEDTSGDRFVDRYVSADTSSPLVDWSRVGSVRLNMELTSVQQIISIDAAAASKEKPRVKLKQNMTSTIGVRNKLP